MVTNFDMHISSWCTSSSCTMSIAMSNHIGISDINERDRFFVSSFSLMPIFSPSIFLQWKQHILASESNIMHSTIWMHNDLQVVTYVPKDERYTISKSQLLSLKTNFKSKGFIFCHFLYFQRETVTLFFRNKLKKCHIYSEK